MQSRECLPGSPGQLRLLRKKTTKLNGHASPKQGSSRSSSANADQEIKVQLPGGRLFLHGLGTSSSSISKGSSKCRNRSQQRADAVGRLQDDDEGVAPHLPAVIVLHAAVPLFPIAGSHGASGHDRGRVSAAMPVQSISPLLLAACELSGCRPSSESFLLRPLTSIPFFSPCLSLPFLPPPGFPPALPQMLETRFNSHSLDRSGSLSALAVVHMRE